MQDAKLILVVDDESRMRRFMHMNLDLEGYRVIEAENGLEAVNRAREDLPDMVLLDVQAEVAGLQQAVEPLVNGGTLAVDILATLWLSGRLTGPRLPVAGAVLALMLAGLVLVALGRPG